VKALLLSAAVLGLFASTSAQASLSPVEQSKVNSYRVGVLQALANSQMGCLQPTGRTTSPQSNVVTTAVERADQAFVDVSGAQPSIVLIENLSSVVRSVVTISTTADYLSITSLRIESQTLKAVNKGTLVAPVVVNDFTTDDRIVCR